MYEKSAGVLFLYVLTPIIDFKDSVQLGLVPAIDFTYLILTDDFVIKLLIIYRNRELSAVDLIP